MSKDQTSTREVIELLTKTATGLLAAAYISGYLIVADHLENFGIRTSGVNILRAKYIWIGFLYLLPFMLLTLITASFWLFPPKWFQKVVLHPATILGRPYVFWNKYPYLIFAVFWVIGVRLIFFTAERREETSMLPCIMLVLLVLHQAIHRIELFQTEAKSSIAVKQNALLQQNSEINEAAASRLVRLNEEYVKIDSCIYRSHRIKDAVCYCALIPFLAIVYYQLRHILPISLRPLHIVWAQSHSDAFTLIGFISTVIALHMQAATAFHSQSPSGAAAASLFFPIANDKARQRAAWVLRSVIMVVLFLASVHGFTHVVYPQIPVHRGGGKYLDGTVVDVCLKPETNIFGINLNPTATPARSSGTCPSDIVVGKVVVLEEEPDALYVASIYDNGMRRVLQDVHSGDRCGVGSWHEGTNAPHVITLYTASIIETREIGRVAEVCPP
jgi:hypothetical protein